MADKGAGGEDKATAAGGTASGGLPMAGMEGENSGRAEIQTLCLDKQGSAKDIRTIDFGPVTTRRRGVGQRPRETERAPFSETGPALHQRRAANPYRSQSLPPTRQRRDLRTEPATVGRENDQAVAAFAKPSDGPRTVSGKVQPEGTDVLPGNNPARSRRSVVLARTRQPRSGPDEERGMTSPP